MRTIIIIFAIAFSFLTPAQAQNMQQEQKEMRRKNHNPLDPPIEKKTVIQLFKLRGYTDSTQLTFSDLATCKMTCLSLNEKDIRNVLKHGNVNVKRSDISSSEKKFAVESDNHGRFRVIVAPNGNALFIITVNEISKTIDCTCK